ncbi:DEAD/DEAH box helicase [Natronoglycomyces albus]|uniref:DEAD/DEAH box helicase n=1 Tax=Natronoglycomyces albus TaxID=2811108 RepID=A0A895XM63_9ACTN|nr:DEAD/DEAH box helicase [Natronoglycomyces albus]QSB06761.1 DEAD/DEAH box helicase [Natronoglycomyces albus]
MVSSASPSPAERYSAAKLRSEYQSLSAFQETYPFELDEFQMDACQAVEKGHGVLVCAPTGAGKTVVGEFAVHLAQEYEGKCFYTTPIKALSNQKYHDLVAAYGTEKVGLLTGDTVINPDASVVVMTTEVLRNMIYASSPALKNLRYVVMDEVHYLADRFRGPVWEEIIIHLPQSVAVISLSATVSNAEEFGDWLKSVRGSTEVVVSEERPVPLWQHMMVGNVLFDVFDHHGNLNPDLRQKAKRKLEQGERYRGRGKKRRSFADRAQIVANLDREALLPAIYFIFSRVGCDAAVEECVHSDLKLTTPEERSQIMALAEERTAHIESDDLQAVGYWRWMDGLARGVAAHHAGLLPVFKETVEELFLRGLIKVVFATETLALGINMPARTVVLERLVKYDGESHVMLTPGQYTQLTGRAGRRGIDVEGHAVTIWSEEVHPRDVAGLASKRTYPLNSSFAPSYNMAVNLIGTAGRKRAAEVLSSSFAQFQTDAAAVHISEQARRAEAKADAVVADLECDRGDFLSYYELSQELAKAEKQAQKRNRGLRRDEAIHTLNNLRPGDIIWMSSGKRAGWAVFIDRGLGRSGSEPRPLLLTASGWAGKVAGASLQSGVEKHGWMKLPKRFNHRDPRQRRDLTASLREQTKYLDTPKRRRRTRSQEDPEVDRLREQLRSHPCHGCPQTASHTSIAARWFLLNKDAKVSRERLQKRSSSLDRQFQAVCAVLEEFDYLSGDAVTDSGQLLRRIFCESDLLVARCLEEGVWEGLQPAELAAVASAVIYESRFEEDEWLVAIPSGRIADVMEVTQRRWDAIHGCEKRNNVALTSKPQMGLVWPMYRWARGEPLAQALKAADGPYPMPGGDFVRWARRTIDLLHQVGDAAKAIDTSGSRDLANKAFAAVDLVRRGVVADL